MLFRILAISAIVGLVIFEVNRLNRLSEAQPSFPKFQAPAQSVPAPAPALSDMRDFRNPAGTHTAISPDSSITVIGIWRDLGLAFIRFQPAPACTPIDATVHIGDPLPFEGLRDWKFARLEGNDAVWQRGSDIVSIGIQNPPEPIVGADPNLVTSREAEEHIPSVREHFEEKIQGIKHALDIQS